MEAIRNAHSIWTYLVLIMGGIAIGQMWRGYRRDEEWRPIDQNIGFYFVSAVDLAILLGVALWVMQGRWDGNDMLRTMRHPTLMAAAWLAIRFGWLRVRQSPISSGKFVRSALFFAIGALMMIAGIFQIYGIF